MVHIHPLKQLSAEEISQASAILKAANKGISLRIKSVSLLEPPKSFMVPYLDAEREGKPLLPPPRRAYIPYYHSGTDDYFEAIINLLSKTVEKTTEINKLFHGSLDPEELEEIETIALKHPDVIAKINSLGLPDNWEVVSDPWIFGNDGSDLAKERMFQMYLYARPKGKVDANHYAHPLNISPIFRSKDYKLMEIQILPTGPDNNYINSTTPYIPYLKENSYLPEDQPEMRGNLKPLRVLQPEGAGYTIDPKTNRFEWQGWSFLCNINYREGAILHDVFFKGRSVAYRISLSDMAVPYGDPRPPFTRKEAFDLGDAGAGLMANNLELGCDCLGNITYLDCTMAKPSGDPYISKNVLCVHEQDNGIGWKHTNFRTNRAVVVRNRELVLQMIITVANYEYILMFIFNQAGDITYEVRATGILSTQPLDKGIGKSPYGTVVSPQVLAANHQHVFCLRLDPAIDGHKNSLVYTETEALPYDPIENPHRVGYINKTTLVEKAGGYDLNWQNARAFKIINPSAKNPVNGQPTGYKIHLPSTQHLVASPESYHCRRAEFADHHVYVTKYKDGEFYAGGRHTNQSPGGAGLKSFIKRGDKIVNDDIVLWIQLGLQHIPRVEDFPVMPMEDIKCILRPTNFFDKNPALDIPASAQSFNKSTLESHITSASNCCAHKL